MYPKLQSHGIAGGDNTGSCAAYAYYLAHENRWKAANGHRGDMIPFYSSDGSEASVDTVIKSIDGNKKGLHVEDAKFYSLVINPSERESEKLGETREEKIRSMQEMVEMMVDRYASGFGKDDVKDHTDLLYFYTIHEFRENNEGALRPGIHAHIIISRKDRKGKNKLSPMTNHRTGSSGAIKSGFNRDAFYRDCETIFDHRFGYARPLLESYAYLNTMSHGTAKEKAEMVRAAVKEMKIIEKVTTAMARRAARLAQEAASKEAESLMARMDTDKKKANEFWNSFNRYYLPLLNNLSEQCKATFEVWGTLKEKHSCLRQEETKQYQELRSTYEHISFKRKEMQDAANSEDLIKAFITLVALANPLPIMIIGVLLQITLEVKRSTTLADIKATKHHAKCICDNIERLNVIKVKLQSDKQDTLREYIQVKSQKNELKEELNRLKKELLPPKENIDINRLSRELSQRKAANKTSAQPTISVEAIYRTLMSAETKPDLDIDLLTANTVIEPIIHPNGGVADLRLIICSNVSRASQSCSAQQFVAMLEKWSELTGLTPAFKMRKPIATNLKPLNNTSKYGKQRPH